MGCSFGEGVHYEDTNPPTPDTKPCKDFASSAEAPSPRSRQHQPVFVDNGVEGEAVPPAGGEVVDVHIRVPETRSGEKAYSVRFFPRSNLEAFHQRLGLGQE